MLDKAIKTPGVLGGILLVIGNVVGAGILALPMAIAQVGFLLALVLLILFWLLMMLGAYYFLEASLAWPAGSNIITMSRAMLGKWGMMIAAICNLLILYSLIAAYISAGGDLIKVSLHSFGVELSISAASIFFLVLFGFIVSRGMRKTDTVNRLLMTVKGVIFLLIIIGLSYYFKFDTLPLSPPKKFSGSLLIVALTSFGFATLVPSLRDYYKGDVQKLRKIIFWGTFIPLICYILWITLVFSIVPYQGNLGLDAISQSSQPVSNLQKALSIIAHNPWLIQGTNIFSYICIMTAFLANSVSLTDFIADGFNLIKKGKKRWQVYVIAYLPPLLAVLFYQKIFLAGLSMSAILAIVQLLILPILIVWVLRHKKDIQVTYSVVGGKSLLVFLLGISLILLIIAIFPL